MDEFDEDVFELSPFTIETDEDDGYQATATLAGTRVRTDLKDIASSISVVTKAFLDDTGATSNESLLQYTTNTEVGGVYGNFSGVGNTQGIGEGRNLSAPSTNTRVRGLDAADNTRNYFLTDIPWDGYIVDRVDLQRGPNSILFGVGSPAGIINTGTIIPNFENGGKLQNRIGSYGSTRHSIDYNHVVIEDVMAVRVAGLMENTKYMQKPAFEKDERGYAAVTIQPDWLGDNVNTTINANFEKGKIRANRPRMLPPVDKVTPWWTGLGQETYNARWAWSNNAQLDRGNSGRASTNPHVNLPWLGNAMGIGNGLTMIYDNGNSSSTYNWLNAPLNYGVGSDGEIDQGIEDFVFGRLQEVAGFNEYTRNAEASALARGEPNPYPGAASNFYKDIHLSNPGVFDFYNVLIDGDNKREWSDWTAWQVSFAQTFFGNRFGYEFVYDYQNYETGNRNLMGGRPGIGIDINTHTGRVPVTYPTAIPRDLGGGVPEPSTVVGGELNPNVGRAYVIGGRPSASYTGTIRENMRLTAFAEFNGSDVFEEDSFLAKLIGRNVFTGLVSRDERRFDERSWLQFALTADWPQRTGEIPQLDGYAQGFTWAVYLSDDLSNTSSPWNLNLPGLETVIDPQGTIQGEWFDSHWNAPDIDPGAFYKLGVTGAESTQSENAANYVGLAPTTVTVLNAQKGDRDQLYTGAFKRTEVLDSYGLTWQGYWWDGMIVPTFGWREDEIATWGASAEAAPNSGLRDPDFLNPKDDVLIKKGETVTWGAVFHTEDLIGDNLPFGTKISLFYNESENFRADNRVGFSGNTLDSPSGESEDYGIVVNTLDDKLTFKVTWYETTVLNANIGSSSPLGSSTWYIANQEAWGTGVAIASEMYWRGELPGMNWFANYGLVDENNYGVEGWDGPPFSDEARNHPSNQALFAAIDDWYATMPDQSFFDAYGFDIDVAKAQSPDWEVRKTAMGPNFNPYSVFAIQPAGGGRVNGLFPTMTINQQSKGVEFEVQARPMSNWNITFNMSKTEATRADLGKDITQFITGQYERYQGPAGDIRQWWGGDSPVRKYYNDFVYQAFLFQQDANGQSAPEIRPWRFNLITNYTFQDGTFRGVNVGGAYRWQDDSILGYELNDAQDKLDVNRPIYGGSEANIDVWAGYQTALTDKLDWRLQLNVRNLFEDERLIPVSVQPDGSMAVGRIAEGMAWELTSTITF